MPRVTSQEVLSGFALVILGALGAGMMFIPIPAANATSLTFVLGALAGAITVSGGRAASTTTTPTTATTTTAS